MHSSQILKLDSTAIKVHTLCCLVVSQHYAQISAALIILLSSCFETKNMYENESTKQFQLKF